MAGSFDKLFDDAGCIGSVHAVRLSTGAEISHDADRRCVSASVMKVPIGLEFYAQVEAGDLDPAEPVSLLPPHTPGPVGISLFRDPVTMSLGDLSSLMLTISDNVATDAVIAAVGIDTVNRRLENLGCSDTAVVGTLQAMLKGFAADLGYESYEELAATPVAVDPVRVGRCRALDATQASHTTARDSTKLLAAVWDDTAASPEACAALRAVMAQQLTRRFARLVVQGGSLAAKSGALFGRVRNEIGVVTDPDGESYAVAVLTRALKPFDGPARQAKIDVVMATAACAALDELRRG